MCVPDGSDYRKQPVDMKSFVVASSLFSIAVCTWSAVICVCLVTLLVAASCLSLHSVHVESKRESYLLTPWCRVLLEKLTGLQLVKKFPAFHGTRRFITALTSVRHLSLSWENPIQSTYPHPTSWRSILILSTHLRLGVPSGLFPPVSPPRPYTPPLLPIRATCPAHLILLDFITRTILGEDTDHLAPRYAVSSIPPLPRPS